MTITTRLEKIIFSLYGLGLYDMGKLDDIIKDLSQDCLDSLTPYVEETYEDYKRPMSFDLVGAFYNAAYSYLEAYLPEEADAYRLEKNCQVYPEYYCSSMTIVDLDEMKYLLETAYKNGADKTIERFFQ